MTTLNITYFRKYRRNIKEKNIVSFQEAGFFYIYIQNIKLTHLVFISIFIVDHTIAQQS